MVTVRQTCVTRYEVPSMFCDRHDMSSAINDNRPCTRECVVTLVSGASGVTLQIDASSPAAMHAGLRALCDVGNAIVTPAPPALHVDVAIRTTTVVATSPLPSGAATSGAVVLPSIEATTTLPDEASWDTVIEMWTDTESVAWSSKTLLDYRMAATRFRSFAQRHHALTMDQVTAQLVDSYKRHLKNECRILPRTINKHLAALQSLFKWGKTAGHFHLPQSPFAGQAYSRRKVKKTSRRRFKFTVMDFAVIFDPKNVRTLKKPHEFWCLFFCFLQAIRIGEAAQIHTSDVTQIDGTWVLFIRPHKTEATERYVPVHPYLIRLGLLDYIADVKRILGNDGMLFPYLRYDKHNGYGDVPSEALGRYLDRLGLPHQERKVLHCARMTLNNTLKQRGVTEEHRCAYVGHAYDTVNSVDYADPMDAVALGKIVMPHLQFDLDVGALRMRSGQFDGVLRRELRRRERQLAHKSAQAAAESKSPARAPKVALVHGQRSDTTQSVDNPNPKELQ